MIEITRPGKETLVIRNHVITASGMLGFDPSSYRHLIKLEKLGAMVTAPVTWKPRVPAHGTRVVPYHGGFLLHTGLPNPGIRQVVQKYKKAWQKSELPIILHLVTTTPEEVEKSMQVIDRTETIVGIELGLHDQAQPHEIMDFIAAARHGGERPILVRLPLYTAPNLAAFAEEAGADALVVAAPPRGTERDPVTGQLIGGRLYGSWLKPQALRAVGQVAHFCSIPVIASGGIHTAQDARDFIKAGARAVQIDTLTWIEPAMVEIIARHLGGLEYTRATSALADEWEPGLGATQAMQRREIPPTDNKPASIPEIPGSGENPTEPADPSEPPGFIPG